MSQCVEITLMYSIEHYIFHRGFESHTDWGPRTVEEFEQFVKIAGLFYRGIVISDSDLNNNPLFSLLTMDKNKEVLQNAFEVGVLRRAARINQDGGVIDQQALFESFKKNSPERGSSISDTHPQKLDKFLEPIENEYKPFVWKVEQLAEVFGNRLVAELSLADFSRDENILAGKIVEYVNELDGDYSRLRAAKIELEILPQWRRSEHQRCVWEQVLQAYNGNLPYAFDGRLIIGDPVEGDKSAIPGGPESNNDEKELAVDYYAALISNKTEKLFAVGEEQLTTSGVHWYLDTKKLRNLSLDQIVELRENASPDEYFNLRHNVLGSPSSLEGNSNDLHEAKNAFWKSLSDAGIALNHSSEKIGRDKAYRIRLKRYNNDFNNKLLNESSKIIMEATPGGGILVALIDTKAIFGEYKDLSQAKRGKGQLASKIYDEVDSIYNISLKRPDYNVVDRLHRRIASEKNNE